MQSKEETKTLDTFNDFIQKNRKGIFLVLGILIAMLAGIVIFISLKDHLQKKAFAKIEELDSRYVDLLPYLKDEDKNDEIQKLLDDLNAFVKSTFGLAEGRGWAVIAQIHSEKEEWQQAEEAWRSAAKAAAASYLAPIAYFNAAAAAEEQGQTEQAIELLEKSISSKFDFAAAPRAQFSIGRLYEGLDNIPEALAAYRLVLSKWPNITGWTELANSRIAALEKE